MIEDSTIDFRFMCDAHLTSETESKQQRGYFERLICAISALNRRTETFHVSITVTAANDPSEIERLNESLDLLTKSLTKREMEIYSLAVSGFSNRAIAETLYISPETVKSHRKNIVKKIHVNRIDDIKNLILRANKLID